MYTINGHQIGILSKIPDLWCVLHHYRNSSYLRILVRNFLIKALERNSIHFRQYTWEH